MENFAMMTERPVNGRFRHSLLLLAEVIGQV